MHSDNQLIRKVKRKQDRQAADELISRYYREVYAFVYRQVCNQELAMDLTQEIFISVIKGVATFDERRARFRTWLYTVASNKITDYFRSKYHRQRILEETLEDNNIFVKEDEMLTNMIRGETVREVMNIIVGYSNVHVQIFQQKIFMDKTFKEIGEQLKLSENTVKTRYYMMLRQVRKEMEHDER